MGWTKSNSKILEFDNSNMIAVKTLVVNKAAVIYKVLTIFNSNFTLLEMIQIIIFTNPRNIYVAWP